MKKVLFAFLVSVLCLSILPAQEEEGDSMFSPSVSIENEFTLPFAKSGEDASKGNVGLDEKKIENETTANFGVGIAIAENFSLKPYIKDALTFASSKMEFSTNKLTLGLGMEFAAMEMLTISADLAYINQLGGLEMDDGSGNMVKLPTQTAHGFQVGMDVVANIESIFLEVGAGYELKGMFAKPRSGSGVNDYSNIGQWDHTIKLIDAKMDFFNFIKEGLNSGLFVSDEVTIGIVNATTPADKDAYAAERTIGNEFTIGLHFAPLEFMDASLGVTVASETVAGWESKDKKYENGSGSMEIKMPIGLEFSKGMFKFGLEYTPTLSKKEHTYASGSSQTTTIKDMEQELKIKVGFEL